MADNFFAGSGDGADTQASPPQPTEIDAALDDIARTLNEVQTLLPKGDVNTGAVQADLKRMTTLLGSARNAAAQEGGAAELGQIRELCGALQQLIDAERAKRG